MATLGAPLAFFVVHAALVTVRAGGPGDCPSAPQLEEALRARLPGVVAVPSLAEAPDVLRLELAGVAAGELTLRLRDGGGGVVLERALQAPPAAATRADCTAFADTVAIIVERYLEQLVVRDVGPARPPVPRREHQAPARAVGAWLLAGARVTAPDPAPAGLRVGLAAGPQLGRGPVRSYVLARAAIAPSASLPDGAREAKLRRVELGVEPGVAFARAAWQIQLGVVAAVDRTGVERGEPGVTWSPWAGPRAAAVWLPGGHVVARASIGADVLLGRLRIETAGRAMMAERYAAPPARLHVGFELGGAFF